MDKDLDSLSAEELGKLFPVILADHNLQWKDIFLSEKKTLSEVIGPKRIFSLEHIGSTSIEGLIAKPTIDILIEIKDETDINRMIKDLKAIGYSSIPKPENPPPHLMFAKGYSVDGYTGQTYHLHIRYFGDWDEIVFRDYLSRNPVKKEEYASLKRDLSVKFRDDREKYTEAKSAFIKDIVKNARKELKNKP